MKVKTLMKCMMYPVDIVEVYNSNFNLIDLMDFENAKTAYGDQHLDNFNIYENTDGAYVLEILLFPQQ